jgi:hypothetical protein
MKHSKSYRIVSFEAGQCFKNQTHYPFIYEKKNIKVIGGIDQVSVNIQSEVLEDLHGPFHVKVF